MTTRPSTPPAPDPWEAAYLRFETPAQESRKFSERLESLGAADWPRDARVVELFCGRGTGLHVLRQLGFTGTIGVDLSPTLAAQYSGGSPMVVGDGRALPLGTGSVDVAIVQGGLHHLPALPEDLERTVEEAWRVLRPGGRLVVVEPWLTPFLSLVHTACESRIIRRLSGKVDALATMIVHERRTYEQWLGAPGVIRRVLEQRFEPEVWRVGWGKLFFVGRRREDSLAHGR